MVISEARHKGCLGNYAEIMQDDSYAHARARGGIIRRRLLLRHFLLAIGFVVFSLALGMLGYWYFENEHVHTFHDAFLHAAMLLGGMGPIDTSTTHQGKIFAGLYALYAGLFFLVIMGLLFAPVLHRLLHCFHWEESSSSAVRQKKGPPNK
jgi:hypothetical protein